MQLTMFGVDPLHIKVSTADTDGRFFAAEITGAEGFSPPRHLHYEQDEWFHVTKGTFVVEVGGEQWIAHPGDSIFAPRNVTHTWASYGEGPNTMIFVLQPAGPFESFVNEAKKLGRLPTPEEANALFGAHEMKITGPPLDVAQTSFEGA